MGGGYNSNQDIISNMASALMTVILLKNRINTIKSKQFSFKVKPETNIENILNKQVGLGVLFG